jgi:hypothetical protein
VQLTWSTQNQTFKPATEWDEEQIDGTAADHLFVNHLPLDFAPAAVVGVKTEQNLEEG